MNKQFRLYARLRGKLEELGINVPLALRQAGLPQQLFDQPRILLTTEQLFALWQAIGDVSGDPAIGLQLGTETKTERFHPMSIAALSTDDLGAAMRHMSRYKLLSVPEEMALDLEEDEFRVQFRWLLAKQPEPLALTEYCFASLLSLARHGTGTRVTPLRVEFVQSRRHGKVLKSYFGCPVVFGAPHDTIVFRAQDASLPLVTRNSELLAMLAPQFEEQLKQQRRDQTFPDRVSEAIQLRLTGRRPTLEDIAGSLHMSSRTLQRRLQDEGTSFQGVLDDARRNLARHYLGNARLELSDTAYLLGYDDATSFARAFRSWEGMAPTQWREAHATA